jgi:hypothetical protein
MQVVQYSDNHFDLWESFVKESKNGTIFQTRSFLSYHPKERFIDKSIMIFEDENLKAVFPAIEFEDKIISHRGSTYGGLIVSKKNRLSDSIEYFKLISEHYKNYKEILFRKQEYIFDIFPSGEVEFGAKQNGFEIIVDELSTCIELENIKLSKGRKWEFSKCKKSLEVKFDDSNYDDFYQILSNNLSSRHDSKPTHSLDEMKKLKEIFPNNYFLIAGYLDGKMVAGIWLVKTNDKTAHTFYIAQNYDYSSQSPLTCVIKFTLEKCKEMRFKYLNFGISTEDGGKVINKGLFEFKESFGGFGVSRYMYRKSL